MHLWCLRICRSVKLIFSGKAKRIFLQYLALWASNSLPFGLYSVWNSVTIIRRLHSGRARAITDSVRGHEMTERSSVLKILTVLSVITVLGSAQGIAPAPELMSSELRQSGETSFTGVTSAFLLPARTNRALSSSVSAGSIGPAITYTCDAAINALGGVCDALNTTIVGLYSTTFTNASASIYIMFGGTSLGQSGKIVGQVNYTAFRNALIAAETDADDRTAVTNSVPSANPFGTAFIRLTNANARALGFKATTGVQSDGATFCPLGTDDCYDGIITISSSLQAAGRLYFRVGAITSSQYDFYTVVEHETDEILGTGSCAFGCSNSAMAPSDLFRYHGDGSRSSAAGDNLPCAAPNTANACFSIDGVNMLQQYNNLNINSEDAGDWAPNCRTPLVQNAAGCLGVAGLDISPTAEIEVLDVVGYTLSASGNSAPSRFVPISPCRIADTRNANGPFGGPAIAGGTTRGFVIPNSACGIPFTAVAYSINVAVVPRGPLAFLTLWPAGQSQPLVSTLNSFDGRVKSNAAIVPAGSSGAVSVFATGPTDVVLDINGYFVAGSSPAALAFYPLTPCRVADTRNAAAPLGGPSLAAQSMRSFPILGSSCGLPANAQAYSLNFAAVPQGPSLAYLVAWPAGQVMPPVSSLNDPTGTVVSNAVIVPAGSNGDVSVFATDATDLVIDVNGYFAPEGPGGLSLYAVTPCRVLDSRQPAGTPPFSTTLDVNVTAAPCGVPATAQAFVLNATVVLPGFLGYITMWSQGQSRPLASTLNAYDGAVTNNMAIVPTTTGSVSVFPSGPTHLVLDIFGYFAP